MANPNLNGKIQLQGELVPDGGNPFQPVVNNDYVTGSPKNFASISDLVAFHPLKMQRGMAAKLVSAPPNGVIKIVEYTLMADPATMYNPQTLASYVTADNFEDYWRLKDETLSNFNRVNEYSPDGPNGSRPPYPYEDNVAFEVNWEPVYDASKGHKWLRFRDDDVDDNTDGIFDNWTVPIALGGSIAGGDYIANAYARITINATIVFAQGSMVETNLGAGDSGHYQVLLGDIDVNDGVTITNLTVGKYFKYNAAYTYTFNNGASAVQTLPAPKTTLNGVSNDSGAYSTASGLSSIVFTDDIPAGTAQLWQILGQKSVYGALKSNWTIRKITENPSLTRYAVQFTALPGSVCTTSDDAAVEPFNTNLNNIGWKDTYQIGTVYLATRSLTGSSPPYTDWTIQKVAGESGEYKDRVFKLFPINSDFDLLSAPSGADAIAEGWSDTPLAETPTEINGISEAIKFFDGTLKTPWSTPVPYTGQNAFNDVIVSDFGNTFKFSVNGATPTIPEPTQMTLEAQLYSGIQKLWPDQTISYEWKRIYNDGAIDNTLADGDTGKVFYFLGSSGTPGDPAYKRYGQRLVVTHQGVDGKAVFQCTQTLVLPDASTIVFIDEFVITDLTDGKDAKDLSVTADKQTVFYDSGGAAFAPTEVKLSAFQNNLPTGFTLYWYYESTPGVWSKLTSGVGGYTFTAKPYGGQMTIDNATVFTSDGTTQTKRYAVSTIDGDPDTNDNITSFSDYITIVKADIAAVGTDGEQAVFGILDNENHSVILDDSTISPQAGEIGSTGKATTIVNVYDGSTRIVQGAGAGKYTVALGTNNPNITAGQQVSGSDIEVYIATWTAGERNAKITITISYETGDTRGTIVFNKVFSVNSTLDAPGAILLAIESADGRFQFTPDNLTDIDLTANLYNDQFTPPLQDPASYYYSWKVGTGAWETVKAGGGGTLGEQRTVTRNEIRTEQLVEVRVFKVPVPTIPDDVVRTASVSINDIQDGKTYRLYQTDSEPYSKPAKPAATIDVTVGDGSWMPSVDPNPAIWAVDGTQRPFSVWGSPSVPEYDWSDVYQIGGEKGDQGNQGGGYFYMYSIYDNGTVKPTFPAPNGNTSSIDEMLAGTGQSEWEVILPTADKIWRTQRLYKGYTATSPTVKLDGSGKLVGGDDSPAEPVTGSAWATPVLISGKDGTAGLDGADGDKGWAPALAVVSDGTTREVLQLIDWVGGAGTKPGNIGSYIGSTGFVATKALAQNIKGPQGLGLVGSDYWDGTTYAGSTSGVGGVLYYRFRLSKSGLVYYNVEAIRTGNGNTDINFLLSGFPANMAPIRLLTTDDAATAIIRASLPGVQMRETQQRIITPGSLYASGANTYLSLYVVDPWKTVLQGCYPTANAFV